MTCCCLEQLQDLKKKQHYIKEESASVFTETVLYSAHSGHHYFSPQKQHAHILDCAALSLYRHIHPFIFIFIVDISQDRGS